MPWMPDKTYFEELAKATPPRCATPAPEGPSAAVPALAAGLVVLAAVALAGWFGFSPAVLRLGG